MLLLPPKSSVLLFSQVLAPGEQTDWVLRYSILLARHKNARTVDMHRERSLQTQIRLPRSLTQLDTVLDSVTAICDVKGALDARACVDVPLGWPLRTYLPDPAR